MADGDDTTKAGEEAEPVDTPSAFLATLGKTLQEKEGTDVALAGIIALHLLTATPAKDGVSRAKEAIVKLAHERASPPNKEAQIG